MLYKLITIGPGSTDVIVHKATEGFRIVGVRCEPVAVTYSPPITWTLLVNESPISGLSNIVAARNGKKIDCEIKVGSTVVLRVSHNQPSVFVRAKLKTKPFIHDRPANRPTKKLLSKTAGLPDSLKAGVEFLEQIGATSKESAVTAAVFTTKYGVQPSDVFKKSSYSPWKTLIENHIKRDRPKRLWWVS